jgi:hypothetical protein
MTNKPTQRPTRAATKASKTQGVALDLTTRVAAAAAAATTTTTTNFSGQQASE